MIRLGSLAVAALAVGCTRHTPTYEPGPEAASHGVGAYTILRADARDVDVAWPGGRLVIHATAERTTQRLERTGAAPITVTTSAESVEIAREAQKLVLARREGDRFRPAGEARGFEDDLALILAVDVDMAVQGSSIVRDGGAYVQCTAECMSAHACAGAPGRCAPHIVLCGACLEEQP